MSSLFLRNFIIYAIVILVSFSALGSAFTHQINRFALQEKMNMLSETLEKATESTVSFLSSPSTLDQIGGAMSLFYTTMTQLASDADGIIFIATVDGRILLTATAEGCQADLESYIPKKAIDDILANGVYSDISNFGGYLSASYFISGAVAETGSTSVPNILIFAATPSETTMVFFINILSTFLLMAAFVLTMTLIVTYFITWSSVRPLNQIAIAARQFARGDFSARIPLPQRHDEIYEMAQSFNNMADSIDRNETMRRDLVANIFHDLRTPMTTIGGFVDGIIDGTIKPDKQKYYLDIVSSEIKRLSRLTNGMLTVSKLEANDELIKAPFDISEMVRRIVFSFEQKLNEKKVNLTLDIPEKAVINANHDSIFQVVYNLFDNALKFVDNGGDIKISLAVKGSKLIFSIENTGSEIDSETIKHIFERFYKSDRSRGGNASGSGLGLYIARTVVGRHGGDITAESSDDRVKFTFNIPTGETKGKLQRG